jgi:hypothetical protein
MFTLELVYTSKSKAFHAGLNCTQHGGAPLRVESCFFRVPLSHESWSWALPCLFSAPF